MQNEQNVVNESQVNIDTTATDTVENEVNKVEQVDATQQDVQPKNDEPIEKTFTQKQVDDLIKARLDRRTKSFLRRYGVEKSSDLDNLIGKSQAYDVMKERYTNIKDENAQLKERIAFLTNNINPDREDDIRAYFKGKDIVFNEENLVKELGTHPEWLKAIEGDTTPKTTIKKLGIEHKNGNTPESEAEKMNRIFGV